MNSYIFLWTLLNFLGKILDPVTCLYLKDQIISVSMFSVVDMTSNQRLYIKDGTSYCCVSH